MLGSRESVLGKCGVDWLPRFASNVELEVLLRTIGGARMTTIWTWTDMGVRKTNLACQRIATKQSAKDPR